MKFLLLSLLLILLLGGSQGVKIQVGQFTFHVDSVLNLKKVMEKEGKDPTQVSQDLCHSSALPGEFNPVCEEANAPEIFNELVRAVKNFDECEICANPACPGCS
ncbi:guanylate cyclase activator 2B-like [Xenopus laevis]|uniref:Guanylate cyclase activator 2B n=1 Tax=Xenopus laevis TaxID=8355 RepID=A0A8J1L8M7_XENLA|nr:guanylate cyclase activator 2B-like [Xenopus laevis]